ESFATQQADSQSQLRPKGGDKYLSNLLHLLLHRSRSKFAVFCVAGKNKKLPIFTEYQEFTSFCFL
ncbi:hypothetical protein PN608_17295, partial [Parabacteroides distasonis]|uniref:hypothetical protein n=1 Tax=Parabacteroides distasonis TaxID=823 RepID=UPI00232A8D34